MPIKNVKQTLKFNAVQIMANDMSQEQSEFINKVMVDKDEEARARLLESLNESQLSELTSMGLEAPTDKVEVTMCLSNILFDCYRANVEMPQAPFPRRIEENRRQEFASLLDKEELPDSLPEELVNATREVLNDNDKWKALNVFAYIDLEDGKKRFVPITGAGVNFYTEVVNAACDLLMKERVVTDINSSEEGEVLGQ